MENELRTVPESRRVADDRAMAAGTHSHREGSTHDDDGS